jgi:hypothetical protein
MLRLPYGYRKCRPSRPPQAIRAAKSDVRYKDVTFETLNQEDFLDAIKEVFPHADWDKAYKEFLAAGEKET